ncbi:hypothetical protein BTO06_03720 [Tenacibaculum sp. SZ-18]|uniref:DUF6438 domain-containing protein n=1 Tax=Tenacibaculum sp. SZ-18 TaxID=754423 RepID=UPI000C2D0A1B|nr:DUF6438 domain-containing protein [Tenacibaculum sp. SZ-18]AUC14303.1 hypothetical protein BTO06_03720 [Tenacibaculum sp. SZ-18]
MKFIYLSILLLALSCEAPKEKKINTGTNAEIPVKKNIKEEPKNQLLGVLNNPKSLNEVKALVTNSGLKWKNMLVDNDASKIVVIEIPDGKLQEWTERLNNSKEFRNIDVHTNANAEKFIAREKNTLLSIIKTPCMGDCPTYSVFIDKKGNVSYEGKEFVLEKGTKAFKLSEKELTTITSLLNKKNFSSYKDVYDNPQIMDLPSTYLTHDGKQVQVRLWNDDVPEELMELNEYIEGILLDKKYFE